MSAHAQEVLVWVQVGSTLVQIAKGLIGDVKAGLEAKGIAVDNATLDAHHEDYQRRIAQANAEAGTPPAPPIG